MLTVLFQLHLLFPGLDARTYRPASDRRANDKYLDGLFPQQAAGGSGQATGTSGQQHAGWQGVDMSSDESHRKADLQV